MLNRFRDLYRRVLSSEELCRKVGGALRSQDGDLLGYIDVVQVVGGRLIIQGWSTAQKVRLTLGGHSSQVTPRISREDLSAVNETDRTAFGFAVEVPYQEGPFQLSLASGTSSNNFERWGFSARSVRWSRFRRFPGFMAKTIAALPDIAMWSLRRNPELRDRVKRKLKIFPDTEQGELAFDYVSATPRTDIPLTIVLPVFNAFDVLKEALKRVAENTDCPWHVVIIEDCSTDARIRPYLTDWCARANERNSGCARLVLNSKNLGFIKSVNVGLDIAIKRGDHVVMLNSDALVPKRWASRILDPIVNSPSVASVTPMSNDAEIFSIPSAGHRVDLKAGDADRLDEVAHRLPLDFNGTDAPTGVGFCMALNKSFLEKVPQLDTIFGKGYGEEVDWCQRTRKLGGRHVVQQRLFVEHRGGTSFGSANKIALIAQNNAKISTRYPDYDTEVQSYISSDPVRTSRLALGLALAALETKKEVSVFLAHSWGGGAELYLRERMQKETLQNGGAVVVRVGGSRRWQIELHSSHGVTKGQCDDSETLIRLLSHLPRRRLIYSCGVGDSDPLEMPKILLEIAEDQPIDVLFHDYFPLTPAYHLLDKNGEFQETTSVLSLNELGRADSGHKMHSKPLSEWRSAWEPLLRRAEKLVVFSQSSLELVARAYPDLEAKILVRPHQLHHPIEVIDQPVPDTGRIGVLGNINAHKGAKVIVDLATKSFESDLPGVALIGNLDPTFAVPKGMVVHGDYALAELPTLVKRYGITRWVIPSVWPETFSYTTHEALATGLAVYVFDLGAQAEAAAQRSNGHIVRLGQQDQRADDMFDAIYTSSHKRTQSVG